jgi:hypothetical protein
MIKIDFLDYGIYLDGSHIADVDDLDRAKFFANAMAINREADTIVINNFTGEIVTEFVVKQRIEIVEVEP